MVQKGKGFVVYQPAASQKFDADLAVAWFLESGFDQAVEASVLVLEVTVVFGWIFYLSIGQVVAVDA